jgi:predicted nucleic acid-binding protein
MPIITTEAVLWEWMNALADPAVRRTAAEGYRRCHSDQQVEVIPFGGEAIENAMRLYEARGDKSWSLTDCFSFVAMRQRQLTDALSADRHFEQSGYRAALGHNPPDG